MPLRYIEILVLVTPSYLLLHAAGELFEEHTYQTCSRDVLAPHVGSQLLQISRFDAASKTSVECNMGIGKEVPLDADGFKEVANSCCYDDMKSFIVRLADTLELRVCDEGGLAGFAPHFSCSNETSFLDLTDEMMAAPKSKCRWLGSSSEGCEPIDPSCGVNLNPLQRKSLLQGYVGIEAENNPPALVKSSGVKEKVKQLIAKKLGVPVGAVEVTIGTGPVGSTSLFQVALKSPRTGRYVEIGPDGNLVAKSATLKTFEAKHEQGNRGFKLGGISAKENSLALSDDGSEELRVTWNNGDPCFQTETGEHVVEDGNGHVVLSRNPEARFQVDFLGFGLLAAHSTVASRRSCTVMVSYEVLQTEPPSIDEEQVKKSADSLDVIEFEGNISHDVTEIEPCLGKLEVSIFKYCRERGTCDNKSLRPAHTDRDYEHVSRDGSSSSNGTNSTLHNGDANPTAGK